MPLLRNPPGPRQEKPLPRRGRHNKEDRPLPYPLQEIRGLIDVFVFELRLEGKDVLFGRVPLAARPGTRLKGRNRQSLRGGTTSPCERNGRTYPKKRLDVPTKTSRRFD